MGDDLWSDCVDGIGTGDGPDAGVSAGVGYRPPNYQVNTNQEAIQAQQAEAIAAGEKARYEVWKMLADDRQALRIKMREKYNVDIE